MFRPQLPDTPHMPTTLTTQHQVQAPMPSAGRPLTPYVGAVAAVIVVGIVLTALLAAVAVTAVSVAIAAVVLRSLVTNANRR
ncbi:SpdD protein [Streptomyces luteolifulvus]|uniref:SpdD protein n=1 Tax=Streptomyces luteolifulvus TaxID=2615112 RepID=A0A643JQL0_9ACTN|nr:SpdD protein [Streptomyces luteolifulvus]KAB1139323.1 SpdD protein [Streptomyces luteolifulvus]